MYIIIGFFYFMSVGFLTYSIRFTGRTKNRSIQLEFFSLNVQLDFFIGIRLGEWPIPGQTSWSDPIFKTMLLYC